MFRSALRLRVEIIGAGAMKGDNLEFRQHTPRRERGSYQGKNLGKWIWCPMSMLVQAYPRAGGH